MHATREEIKVDYDDPPARTNENQSKWNKSRSIRILKDNGASNTNGNSIGTTYLEMRFVGVYCVLYGVLVHTCRRREITPWTSVTGK